MATRLAISVLEAMILVAYFSVPVVIVLFVRRFRTILLAHIREELVWFAVLTASGGVDHVLTGLGVLPQSVSLQCGLALTLVTAAGKMIHTKVKMARHLEYLEKAARDDQLAYSSALRQARSETIAAHGEVARAQTATLTAEAKEKETNVRAHQSKKNFMAVLLHEMRNPMQTIVAMTDVLISTVLTTIQTEAVGAIIDSITLMRRLADDVLDLSKLEAGKLQIEHVPFDLKQCITTSVQGWAQQAAQKKIGFTVDIDHKLPKRIVLDPARFHQIVLNLVSNAFKFTLRGSVKVEVSTTEQPATITEKSPQSDSPDGKIGMFFSIVVTDTGIGLKPEELEGLFAPYSQMKLSTYREHGGTGLGLSITKQLTEAMGGTITVHSRVLEGSRFTVKLPLVQDDAPERPHTPIPTIDKQTAGNHIIVLVDDNVVIRKLIGRMLTELGFIVKTAEDGIEGFDAVSREMSRIALVFMDLTMPRMDGYTAAGRMREVGYKGPIIALTAKASSDESDTVKRHGMDDILWKPVCKRDLIVAICRHVPSMTNTPATAGAAPALSNITPAVLPPTKD